LFVVVPVARTLRGDAGRQYLACHHACIIC